MISALLELLLIYIALGTIVGLIAGFIGGGGGVITVTILIFTFTSMGYNEGVIVHTSVGTSLFLITFAAASSSIVHLKRRMVYLDLFAVMAIFGALGAWIGGTVSAVTDATVFKSIFAILLLSISWKLYRQDTEEKKEQEKGEKGKKVQFDPDEKRRITIFVLSGVCGFLSGLTSGFFGIGGAIIMLPAALFLLKFSMLESIAHATCLMMVSAFVGAITHIYYGIGVPDLPPYSIGYVNYAAGITMAIVGTTSSRWAAKKVHSIDHQKLIRILILVLIFAALIMIVK